MTVLQAPAETLLLPVWVTVVFILITIPLGLLVGYVAFKGFRRGSRPTAQALALGLIFLTAVNALLGLSISFNQAELIGQRGPIARALVQTIGLALIIYAIYTPADRRSSEVRTDE